MKEKAKPTNQQTNKLQRRRCKAKAKLQRPTNSHTNKQKNQNTQTTHIYPKIQSLFRLL